MQPDTKLTPKEVKDFEAEMRRGRPYLLFGTVMYGCVALIYLFTVWTLFSLMGWFGLIIGLLPGIDAVAAVWLTWHKVGHFFTPYNILFVSFLALLAVQKIWCEILCWQVDHKYGSGRS